MRRVVLLMILAVSAIAASAQYCGGSGPGVCIPSNTVTQPGMSPLPDSLPPFINGINVATTIQFKNFDTVYLQGSGYVLSSLRVDSIGNLPSGLCWSTNKSDNTFGNKENGCILVSGTTCSTPGQYKLQIFATVGISSFFISVDANDYGLRYFVRVNNYGEATIAIDSTQTPTNAFIPYGPTANCITPLIVNTGADQAVCNGSIITLDPQVTGGQGPYTYSWHATGSTLSCNNCASPTSTVTGNSIYTVVVTDANNATATDTVYYSTIGPNANFTINAGSATSFCGGGSVSLSATSANGITYQWQLNDADISNATSNTYTANSSGNYSVSFVAGGACHATSNIITVTVTAYPAATIGVTSGTTFCQGDSVVLSANTGSGLVYQWQLNGSNIAATASHYTAYAAGSYSVIESNGSCADTSAARTVVVNALPTVALALSPDTVCIFGGVVAISGGTPAGGTYTGTGVSGTSYNPSTAGLGAHTIQYAYTDNNQCRNTASQTVNVLNCVTGIAEVEAANSIAIYPNPASDKLTLASELFANGNITPTVFDITGKQIAVAYTKQANKFVLNTSALTPGIYLVKLYVNGIGVSKQFTKN